MSLTSEIENFIISNRFSGKRETFSFSRLDLRGYIGWAFFNNYLFVALRENGISGVGVAYPLPKPFDGTIESLLVFEDTLEREDDKQLVVMDWVASDRESRSSLVKKFKNRFRNWENQEKLGIHYGRVKNLSNEYINKLENI